MSTQSMLYGETIIILLVLACFTIIIYPLFYKYIPYIWGYISDKIFKVLKTGGSMRKKKLLSRIYELESENARLKDNEDYWKDLIMQFAKGLHEHGVEAEIVFPRGPEIETTELDGKPKYIYGRNTEPPTLRFDFTEHDEKVRENGN